MPMPPSIFRSLEARKIQISTLPDFGIVRHHTSLAHASATSAGITDRVCDMTDVAALIAAQEAPIAKHGPYKKKAA
jgi:hypothetical protein